MSPPIGRDAFSEGLVANNWGIHGTYDCRSPYGFGGL